MHARRQLLKTENNPPGNSENKDKLKKEYQQALLGQVQDRLKAKEQELKLKKEFEIREEERVKADLQKVRDRENSSTGNRMFKGGGMLAMDVEDEKAKKAIKAHKVELQKQIVNSF